MRGVRFNFVKRLVDATPREVFFKIADKIAPLGWHIVVYFEAQDLEGLTPFLKQLPAVIVVDHMGRPDIAKGVEHPDFRRFIDLMAENSNIWSKVSCPERLSSAARPIMRTWRRSRARWSTVSRTACCGAPTGRTRT